MVGAEDVGADLVQGVQIHACCCRLSALDNALLHGLVHLGHCHRSGGHAKTLESVHVDIGLGGADDDALAVFNVLHFLVGEAHCAEAGIEVTENGDVVFSQRCFAVSDLGERQNLAEVLIVLDEERLDEHGDLGGILGHKGGVEDTHVKAAHCHGLGHLDVVAEGAAVVVIKGDLSAGALFDCRDHCLCALDGRNVAAVVLAESDNNRLALVKELCFGLFGCGLLVRLSFLSRSFGRRRGGGAAACAQCKHHCGGKDHCQYFFHLIFSFSFLYLMGYPH